jgi:glycosyltransferase involved in cell wall biosynthesis
MSEPAVSVILPAWNSHETIGACLQSLRTQSFRGFEVIVVDSSPGDETEKIVREQFPEVRFHHSPRRLLPHAARNLGVSLARGQILVFSDPDCRMSDQWLDLLVRAHQDGHAVVGGSVANLDGGWFADGVHLCKYAWWLPGGSSGGRPELPSANMSFSSPLFSRIGPFPEEWCGDTLLSQNALAEGITPWFEPSARITHDHRATWPLFLHERFERGYDNGLVLPRVQRWTRLRTLAYVLGTPLILPWMTARALLYAAKSSQSVSALRCLPILVAGYAAWLLGEARAHWRVACRAS